MQILVQILDQKNIASRILCSTGEKKAFNMKLTNLNNGVGFINFDDIMARMAKRTPPEEDHYIFRQLEGRIFSEVAVKCYDKEFRIFLVCTHRKPVYEFVRSIFHAVAASFKLKAISKDWKKR